MDAGELENLWNDLYEKGKSSTGNVARVYRAIGKTAIGVRASYLPLEDHI